MPKAPRPHLDTPAPMETVVAALSTTFTGAIAILSRTSVQDLTLDSYATFAAIMTAIAAARGGISLGIPSAIAGALASTALIALGDDAATGGSAKAFFIFVALAIALVVGAAFRTRADTLFGASGLPHSSADATALAQARTYLATTQQIAHIGTWEAILIGNEFPLENLRCSEELFRIYGVDVATGITGENLLSRSSQEDRQRAEQEFASAISQRRPYDLEHRIVHPDGTPRWVHERGVTHVSEDGTRTFLVTVQDITELIEARHDLEEAELRWRSMVTTAPDLILTTDLERRFTYINHAAPGFDWEGLKGKRLEEITLGSYHRVVVAAMVRARTTGQPVTFEILVQYPDSMRRMVCRARTLTQDGEPTGFIIIATDVTEEREVMERIRTQEARFRRLLENSWDAIVMSDDKGRSIDASPSIAHVLGYTTFEFCRIAPQNLVLKEDLPTHAAATKNALEHPGKAVRFTVRLRHKDGSIRWTEAVTVNRLGEHEVGAVVTNIRDVTAQRHAEEESRRKERFAQAVFDKTVDTNVIMTVEGTIIDINQAGVETLGFTTEQLIGKNSFSLIHEEDRATAEAAFRRRVTRPASEQMPTSYRVRTGSGKTVWLESIGVNLLDDPSVRGILVISRDVTDRMRADAERRATDAKFRAIIEHSFDLVHLIDAAGKIIFASPSFLSVLGHDPAAIVGTDGSSILHPEDSRETTRTIMELARTPGATTTRRVRVRHKNGGWRTLDTIGTNLLHVPEIGAIVLNSRDATDQIGATEALEHQNRYVQAIIDNSIDGISIYDMDGNARMVSVSSAALLGYSAKELKGRPMPDLIHPDDLENLTSAFTSLKEKPDKTLTYTYRMRRKDGTWGWFESVSRNMMDNNAINGILINTRDVSETVHGREELARQEARFRGMIEHMAEGVQLLDKEGVITYATPAITRLFGYPLEKFVGSNTREHIHPDDLPRVLSIIKTVRGTHLPTVPYEVRLKKMDGTYLLVEAVAVSLEDDPAVHSIVIYTRDISERKRAEARMHELDALKNKFIQVVSHQFRTPLNVVRWNLETLLADELGSIPPVQKEFIRITYQANSEVIARIHDLLTALDIEEERVVLTKEPVSLESLLGGVMAEIQKTCTLRGITCTHATSGAPLPSVQADPEKIRLVLEKMTDNAVSYTPSGGTVHATLALKEGRIRFEVTDTGIGVPAAEQQRIFERFYRASNSSIQKQDASGLGLSITKYFIEQHGGTVGLRSTEGKGSTFWFEIPLTGDDA